MFHYLRTYDTLADAQRSMNFFLLWAPEASWNSTHHHPDGSVTVAFSVDATTDAFMDIWMPKAVRLD